MAKINKQEVIQKLVDELNLYPGKDLIPSELADKILATYQINTQEVSVKTPTADVVKSIDGVTSTTTIYTTPATGKFYLTNVSLSCRQYAGSGAIGTISIEITIDGVATELIPMEISDQQIETSELSFNLQNPILIDKATTISARLDLTGLSVTASASIVGYTE